jgi:hypothetical protein
MDGGFKNRKAQGSKRVKQDLTIIIFELRVDCGLISRKNRGSLAKRLVEAVSSILDARSKTNGPDQILIAKGYACTVAVRSGSNAPDISLLSDPLQHAGSRMDGSDLKQGANRYERFRSLGSRSQGSDPPRARSNLTRSTPIGRLREKWKEGAALRRRRPKSAAARLGTRRSSAFPPLRWPKLHDFRPRSTTEARGSDLGLRLGLEGLGHRARR